MLPGNPPMSHFYENWKTEIIESHKNATIKIASYHCFPLKQSSAGYFQRMIDTLKEDILEFQKNSTEPVTLIGHSFGGFLALNLMNEISSVVSNCLLLYPFLKAPGPVGQTVLAAVKNCVQLKFEKNILAFYPYLQRISPMLKKLDFLEAQTGLHIAYHEYFTIGQNKSPLIIPNEIRSKINLFYTLNDTWCPVKTIDELKSQIPCHELKSPHTFVLWQKEREKVFEQIAPFCS